MTGLKQRIQHINLFLTLVGTGLTELKQTNNEKQNKVLWVNEQNLQFENLHAHIKVRMFIHTVYHSHKTLS